MKRRPPLIEVWHWSWLDTRWTMPLGWWLAWHPEAIPVGGSDWHQPGHDAPPGTPTTWVEAEAEDPAAVLEAIRAGRTAVSAGRDGPVLLRVGDELVASDADGSILVGPDGPKARVRGDAGQVPGRGRLPPPGRPDGSDARPDRLVHPPALAAQRDRLPPPAWPRSHRPTQRPVCA